MNLLFLLLLLLLLLFCHVMQLLITLMAFILATPKWLMLTITLV